MNKKDILAELERILAEYTLSDELKLAIKADIAHLEVAPCFSCAWNHVKGYLLIELPKYGVDLAVLRRFEAKTPKTVSKKETIGRYPCTACTLKHLSQAFILQAEYYMGYFDYLPLIMGHLQEAIDECPEEAYDERQIMEKWLNSIENGEKPRIDYETIAKTITHEYKVPDEPRNFAQPHGDLEFTKQDSLYVPKEAYNRVIHWLKRAETEESVVGWSACVAIASDLLAPWAPYSTNVLRNRRLLYGSLDSIADIPEDVRNSGKLLSILENGQKAIK